MPLDPARAPFSGAESCGPILRTVQPGGRELRSAARGGSSCWNEMRSCGGANHLRKGRRMRSTESIQRHTRHTRRRGAPITVLVLAGLLLAGSGCRPADALSAGTTAANAAPSPRVVEWQARDYSYEAPDTLP